MAALYFTRAYHGMERTSVRERDCVCVCVCVCGCFSWSAVCLFPYRFLSVLLDEKVGAKLYQSNPLKPQTLITLISIHTHPNRLSARGSVLVGTGSGQLMPLGSDYKCGYVCVQGAGLRMHLYNPCFFCCGCFFAVGAPGGGRRVSE